MVTTHSSMLPLGTPCPDFSLKDTEGNLVSLNTFQGAPVLVVMFICNHCPYVMHLRAALANLAKEYQKQHVAFLAINSNDTKLYPADSFECMIEEKVNSGYTFPYAFDETQEIAKKFRAACTPDFFVFNKERKLTYRGRFDSTKPGSNEPAIGEDLRNAIDATLQGTSIPEQDQKASVGCNIKWKPGNEPNYS